MASPQPVIGVRAVVSSTWYWQNPLPRAYSMQAVACPSLTHCVAVGQSGSITTTSDGGRHWTSRASRTTADLAGVSCPAQSVCYAAGSVLMPTTRNIVLKSVDGGVTWFQPSRQVSVPKDQVLEGITCAAPTVCFMNTAIVESTTTFIYRSTDGGRTWRNVTHSIPGTGPLCLANGVCFAWSGHVVFRSKDAGATWMRWSQVPGSAPHVSLVCPQANTCLAVSQPRVPADVFLTRDDGKTWRRVIRVGPVVDLLCGSATTCYLFEPSNVVETANGGRTWRSYPFSLPDFVFQPVCPGPTTCYATAGYTALKTTDGFRHIQQTPDRNFIPGLSLASVSCPSATICYASSFYPSSPGVAATRDGGSTWHIVPGKSPDHVICPSVTVCYSFGSPDAPPSQVAYPFRSDDGARSWRQLTIPLQPSGGATCVDEEVCYVLATSPGSGSRRLTLLVTRNRGTTWSTKTSISHAAGPSAVALYPRPLSCPSVSTCFVAAARWSGSQSSLTVFRTRDAGGSWSASAPVPSPPCTARCVNALDCPTVSTCYLIPLGNTGSPGSPIISVVTHDAGVTWRSTAVNAAGVGFLRDISCADAQHCGVVGLGSIYGTSDGGNSWHKQSVPGGDLSLPDLQGIACHAADTCYAVGDEAILATHPPSRTAASSRRAVQDQSITPSPAPVPASAVTSPMPTKTGLPGASGILFQVASQGWTQGMNGWTPDEAPSWTVQNGALTSTGKGRKLCDFDEGTKYCRYEALILAPYRMRTARYAIEAEIRFSNPGDRNAFAGIVFRAHGLSVSPAPLVIASSIGLLESCGWGHTGRGATLGMCAYTGDLSVDRRHGDPPIWSYSDHGGWHLYRIEVRGTRYRLSIDGRQMEVVTDTRSRTDFGDRFGFFATVDPVAPQHISVRSVKVVALQPPDP